MSKRSGIMLAYPLEEKRLLDPKFQWKFPVIVQPKLNGERSRVVMDSFGFSLLSSECNRIVSVPHINKQLASLYHHLPFIPTDGELYVHGWDFNEIHSVVSRKSDETRHERSEQMEFHVFDLISDDAQLKRSHLLFDKYSKFFGDSIRIVPIMMAYNMTDIMRIYDDYLDLGYEGIVVRHIKAPYIKRHSRFMLKFKPKKSDYYKIDSVTEAISKYGNPLGILGAFWCEDLEGTTFKIGAGKLKHDKRKELWKDRQSLRGKFCHVQYQTLSPRGAPIFGLCMGDILDNNPEEASGGGIL